MVDADVRGEAVRVLLQLARHPAARLHMQTAAVLQGIHALLTSALATAAGFRREKAAHAALAVAPMLALTKEVLTPLTPGASESVAGAHTSERGDTRSVADDEGAAAHAELLSLARTLLPPLLDRVQKSFPRLREAKEVRPALAELRQCIDGESPHAQGVLHHLSRSSGATLPSAARTPTSPTNSTSPTTPRPTPTALESARTGDEEGRPRRPSIMTRLSSFGSLGGSPTYRA
mmetsp:Transcript_18058/g.36380  ORF Transcript_18058/g.36380 Transcript_18058/m.36380 type:complete len:233 (-) Transcript_18058:239-937(-)